MILQLLFHGNMQHAGRIDTDTDAIVIVSVVILYFSAASDLTLQGRKSWTDTELMLTTTIDR